MHFIYILQILQPSSLLVYWQSAPPRRVVACTHKLNAQTICTLMHAAHCVRACVYFLHWITTAHSIKSIDLLFICYIILRDLSTSTQWFCTHHIIIDICMFMVRGSLSHSLQIYARNATGFSYRISLYDTSVSQSTAHSPFANLNSYIALINKSHLQCFFMIISFLLLFYYFFCCIIERFHLCHKLLENSIKSFNCNHFM